MRRFITLENFVLVVLLVIILNLVYIDYNFYQNKTNQNIDSPVQGSSDCPGCSVRLNNLEVVVNKLMEKNGISPTPIPTTAPEIRYIQSSVNTSSVSKEYYIPFGSGSGDYSDWTDVPGLQAYIDSTSYGNINTVTFEGSIHVPSNNQIVSIRLLNATENRVIGGSQLDFNGGPDSVFKASVPITLDYGQKLYKVQLKTQLRYNTIIDQARVHIVTQ